MGSGFEPLAANELAELKALNCSDDIIDPDEFVRVLDAFPRLIAELERLRTASYPFNRDFLGQVVRSAWIEWAKAQPYAKPSWLLPWNEMQEADREADRMIGEKVAHIACSILEREIEHQAAEVEQLRLVEKAVKRYRNYINSVKDYSKGEDKGWHAIHLEWLDDELNQAGLDPATLQPRGKERANQ